VENSLLTFHILNNNYLSKAENDLRLFFKTFNKNLEHKDRKELVVLNNIEFKSIKKQYEYIGREYNGYNQLLYNKINELEHELAKERLEKELIKQNLEMNTRIHELQIKLLKNVS